MSGHTPWSEVKDELDLEPVDFLPCEKCGANVKNSPVEMLACGVCDALYCPECGFQWAGWGPIMCPDEGFRGHGYRAEQRQVAVAVKPVYRGRRRPWK